MASKRMRKSVACPASSGASSHLTRCLWSRQQPRSHTLVHRVGFWATKQTASIHRRTIGHLGSVGFIQMLRVDTGMRR
jgi:hypothetical protein